ncbi:MAG: hypothetical protein KKF44_05060, partial [Nanoarchaeota archaeon]|nr:hypothetical protein [Nanoarchaeota archaeon]
INKNTVCFLQEQWGVAATAVCFKDNIPFYYDRLQTKGNHQRSELTWQVLGKEGIIQKNTCPSDSSIFCSIFKAALENDPFVCDKIETFRDNCEIFS